MDLIVKYGTEALVNGQGMDNAKVNFYAADLAEYINDGSVRRNALIVATGAVAVGKCYWQELGETDTEIDQQEYAIMGSGLAAVTIQMALKENSVAAGPLWLTHYEIDNRKERPTLKAALKTCKRRNIVPIINENDALSVRELAKLSYGGDNDGIAAHLCKLTRADNLIIFTAKGGLIDNDGREVRVLESDLYKGALKMVKERESCRTSKSIGRGGMSSKLRYARKAANSGTTAFIARSGESIKDVLTGKTGTRVVAKAH